MRISSSEGSGPDAGSIGLVGFAGRAVALFFAAGFFAFVLLDLRRAFSLSMLAAGDGELGSLIALVLLFFGTGWFLFEFNRISDGRAVRKLFLELRLAEG